MFIWYFVDAILSKNSYQKQGGGLEKDKKEGWSYSGGWGVSKEGGQNLLHSMH